MMRKLRAWLAVVSGLLGIFAAAELLADWLGTDRKLTLLAVMCGAAGLVSVAIALQQRKLRRQLMQLPEHERKALSLVSDEVKHAFPPAGIATVRNTILAGKVLVNGPIVPLMVGPLCIMQTWVTIEPPIPQFIALGGGFAAAWLWWSVAVCRWRLWAQSRGMSAAEVQHHGEAAGLLWPRGHFLERTEWRRK